VETIFDAVLYAVKSLLVLHIIQYEHIKRKIGRLYRPLWVCVCLFQIPWNMSLPRIGKIG